MTRPAPDNVTRVTCVGSGTIGSGWAAWFLAQGMDVTMTDPAPDAEAKAKINIDQAWPYLEELGLKPGASRDRLSFEPDLAVAVAEWPTALPWACVRTWTWPPLMRARSSPR